MTNEMRLSTDTITAIQQDAWKKTFQYAIQKSPFYRNHLSQAGFTCEDFPDLKNIGDIPLTDKKMLSSNTDQFLCVSHEKVIDMVTTSGSTGHPLAIMLTEADLNRLAYNEYLSFRCAGINASDSAILAVTLDRCFMAGMAYFLGLRKLGTSIARLGQVSASSHLDAIARLMPSVIVGVPSFLAMLSQKATERNMNLASCSVKKLICIGEPVRDGFFTLNTIGKRLEQAWGARVYSSYGNTELAISLCECESGLGGHLHPELLFIEILDDFGKPVQDGEFGEIVATTFGIEGMPLIRYKTGDIAAVYRDRCTCGRTTPRLGPIMGRKAQKLKFKGTTLYPSTFQAILESTPGVAKYVIVASRTNESLDYIKVFISCSGEKGEVIELLRDRFRGEAKVVPEISLALPEEIENMQMPEGSRKRRVFVDLRY